ncbi:hypothetical protein AAG570_010497 [Ranatra chinensis]|uniref:Gustatory receptor n=1 Tax=Ranatra chinensis TaxID=642074 RepID=A0ABD0YMU1_9HEMI
MASKRRNMFHKNKKQEATEIVFLLQLTRFIQIMSINEPVIELAGFVTINRGLCVSVSKIKQYILKMRIMRFGSRIIKSAIKMKEGSVYYRELRPVVFTLKLIGRFPYQMNSKGEMHVGLRSTWSAYTVITYATLSLLTLPKISSLARNIQSGHMDVDKMVTSANSFMLILFHYYVIVLAWKEWPLIAAYFNKWAKFQMMLERHTGETLKVNLRAAVWTGLTVTTLTAAVPVYLLSYMMSSSFLSLVPYVVTIFSWLLYLMFWTATCALISSATDQIIDFFRKVSIDGRARDVWRCRLLWLWLGDLCRGLGDCVAWNLVPVSLFLSASFLSTSYALLTPRSRSDDPTTIPPPTVATIMLVDAFYLLVLVEAAHRTTSKLGQGMTSELMKLDSSDLDPQTSHELDLFMQAVTISPPVVKFAGFTEVDRTVLVSVNLNMLS